MSRSSSHRRLFLAFDAFGTLFTPRKPVAVQYCEVARRHGVEVDVGRVERGFRAAFKDEAKRHPNYGRETGLRPAEWWGNIIKNTFQPLLPRDQQLPPDLIPDLLTRFSTKEGYSLYPDVLPFFQALRASKKSHFDQQKHDQDEASDPSNPSWPWEFHVGIITNSDDRVPGILQSFGLNIGARRLGSTAEQVRKATEQENDVDFVVLSYDVGAEKPDRRIFEAAERMFVESCEEVEGGEYEMWYVGDDVEKDLRGAEGAGWKGVLLDRGEREGRGGVEDSVKTIRDLSELRGLVVRDWKKSKSKRDVIYGASTV